MSTERTEAPTPKRIHDARLEGQVARSVELNAAAALLVGALLLHASGGRLIGDAQSLIINALAALRPAGLAASSENPGAWLMNFLVASSVQIAPGLGLIVLSLLATGVVVSVAQTGLLFTTKKLGFDFNRVNLLQGLKRILSFRGLAELIKALIKLGVVVWVAYTFLRARVPELLGLNQTDFLAALKGWATLALSLALRVGGAYLVVAFIDYGYQRWQYLRSLRMSKQEIKEEIKQQEGDPVIRGRIRSQQRRMTRHRMMANVPKADVVITNPTHLAIAIQYDAEEMKAPKVLAKGAHHTAERIVALARQHGIPVVQDIPVARALYRHVEIDQEIPAALYAAVAQILAYVFRLQGRMGGTQAEAR